MKNLIRLEELGMLTLSVFGLYWLNAPWWTYLLMLAGPDISMLGYAAGNRTGAVLYNLFHHKGIGIAFFVMGLVLPNEVLLLTGIILFGHASLDRCFGYGLKLNTGFKHTHLGLIGTRTIGTT